MFREYLFLIYQSTLCLTLAGTISSKFIEDFLSLHKSYLVTHGKSFEFGLVSDGKEEY